MVAPQRERLEEKMAADMQYRKELARQLLAAKIDDVDLELAPDLRALRPALLAAGLPIAFPPGLEPVPKLLAATPDPNDALPRADVLVITWTVDEQDAMCDVLTPGNDRK